MGQELGIPKPRKETGQAMWMIDYFDGTDMTDLPRWLEDMLPPNPETGVKDPRIGMLSDILTHPDLKLPQLLQKVQSIINLLANEEQIIREQLFPKSGEKYTSNPEAVVSMLNRHRFHEINDLILNWLARNYIQNNHDSFFKNGSESALYVSQYENPHLIKGLAGAIELIATTTQNPMTIVSVGCGKGPIESMVDIQLSSTTKRRWLGLEPNPPAEKERGFFKGRMYPLDTDSPLSYIEMLQKENIHIDPRHTVVFLFNFVLHHIKNLNLADLLNHKCKGANIVMGIEEPASNNEHPLYAVFRVLYDLLNNAGFNAKWVEAVLAGQTAFNTGYLTQEEFDSEKIQLFPIPKIALPTSIFVKHFTGAATDPYKRLNW